MSRDLVRKEKVSSAKLSVKNDQRKSARKNFFKKNTLFHHMNNYLNV